jgi:hypothetical protein
MNRQFITLVEVSFITVFYFSLAYCLSVEWFKLYRADTSLTKRERQRSYILVVVITVLWPLVIPFSYLELLKKKVNKLKLKSNLIEIEIAANDIKKF